MTSTSQHDPLAQLRTWMDDARDAGDVWVGAMTLSTVSASGDVSARVVYLKELDDRGFVFSSSGPTRKTDDLAANAGCALTFWWPVIGRQVRVVCRAERLDDAQRRRLFEERPPAHRAVTLASRQGEPIVGVDEVADRARALLDEGALDCPPADQFVAYRAVPSIIEFWERSDEDRLHRRTEWRELDGAWSSRRLAP